MKDCRDVTKLEAFRASCKQFAKMIGQMQSESTAGMSHAELEDLLTKEGDELLCCMMQDHVDLHTIREQRVEIVDCTDGVERNHVRHDSGRNLESVFGTVRIKRMAYSQHEVPTVHPLDLELNLPEDKYSHGIRRRLAEELAKSSFDNAVESIASTTGGRVPKRQAEELAARMAKDFDAFYLKRKANG